VIPIAITRHMEQHLGPMRGGRKVTPHDEEPFFVVEFADRPGNGETTFVTLGLSQRLLRSPAGAAPARQELLFSAGNADPAEAKELLADVALRVAASEASLDRGAIVGPRGPLFSGSRLEAFYCVPPAYFPESLAVCRAATPPVIVVWLVPITASEAAFVSHEGPRAFEVLLQAQRPDLLDVRRAEIVLTRR
jgi:hypothetical protein